MRFMFQFTGPQFIFPKIQTTFSGQALCCIFFMCLICWYYYPWWPDWLILPRFPALLKVWFQNRRSKERRMKQLSALSARRHMFYRSPRRMRALGERMEAGELGHFSYYGGELCLMMFEDFYSKLMSRLKSKNTLNGTYIFSCPQWIHLLFSFH